jgi:hypothetical protein
MPTFWEIHVLKALHTAAGRDIKFDDAFRLGKFVPDKPPQPILVKIFSSWDKRSVLGGLWRLKDSEEFSRVYNRDDLPLAARRRSVLERLRYRATHEGGEISVTNDGILTIDGTNVLSLQDGFLQPRNDGRTLAVKHCKHRSV